MNNMEKESQRHEDGPEVDIHLESLRATLKKVLNWKKLSHDGIHGF